MWYLVKFEIRNFYRLLLLLSLIFANGLQLYGQGRPRRVESDQGREAIRLRATLVQVPVIVSDSGGRYITDLRKEDFEIFEDGGKQEIELFGTLDEPFSVALVLDSSGSTSDQLALIKAAARAFIDNLRDQDRVIVFSFNDSVVEMCELTGDRNVLKRAVDMIGVGEYTQVYEAVYTAVWERLRKVAGRKAVILFSDGIDTASSEIGMDDTLDAVVEVEDIVVYPVRYNTRPDVVNRLIEGRRKRLSFGSGDKVTGNWYETIEKLDTAYRYADEYLNQLADLSGGVVERADKLEDLKGAFARIAEELRHQYLLGFYPEDEAKRTGDRKIRVSVNRPGLRIRARPGYR